MSVDNLPCGSVMNDPSAQSVVSLRVGDAHMEVTTGVFLSKLMAAKVIVEFLLNTDRALARALRDALREDMRLDR